MNLQLFFERLKAERQNRGLNQDDMAKKVGVSKRSYCAYEAGETAPNAKLLAELVLMGVDIAYILTGQRSQPVPESATLPPRERALLDNYRHTDESGKKVIESTASFAAQSDARKKA